MAQLTVDVRGLDLVVESRKRAIELVAQVSAISHGAHHGDILGPWTDCPVVSCFLHRQLLDVLRMEVADGVAG